MACCISKEEKEYLEKKLKESPELGDNAIVQRIARLPVCDGRLLL